jgi:hypothetical protein
MDLTGSIANATAPLSTQLWGSVDGVGSSFIDTAFFIVRNAPGYLLGILAGIGADLGSTLGD